MGEGIGNIGNYSGNVDKAVLSAVRGLAEAKEILFQIDAEIQKYIKEQDDLTKEIIEKQITVKIKQLKARIEAAQQSGAGLSQALGKVQEQLGDLKTFQTPANQKTIAKIQNELLELEKKLAAS